MKRSSSVLSMFLHNIRVKDAIISLYSEFLDKENIMLVTVNKKEPCQLTFDPLNPSAWHPCTVFSVGRHSFNSLPTLILRSVALIVCLNTRTLACIASLFLCHSFLNAITSQQPGACTSWYKATAQAGLLKRRLRYNLCFFRRDVTPESLDGGLKKLSSL